MWRARPWTVPARRGRLELPARHRFKHAQSPPNATKTAPRRQTAAVSRRKRGAPGTTRTCDPQLRKTIRPPEETVSYGCRSAGGCKERHRAAHRTAPAALYGPRKWIRPLAVAGREPSLSHERWRYGPTVPATSGEDPSIGGTRCLDGCLRSASRSETKPSRLESHWRARHDSLARLRPACFVLCPRRKRRCADH